MTTNVLGYAAKSAQDDLSPYRFARRDARANDVAIEILCCGPPALSPPPNLAASQLLVPTALF